MYQIRLITSFSPYTETPLYTEATQDAMPVESAHFTTEINEGGTIEFTLAYGHPYYDLLEPMVSYVSLVDDEGEVLYGRIFDKSDPTITGRITYQVEGALSFLQDSEVEPETKDADGNYNTRTLTAEAFFRWCIAQHNADTNDIRRRFAVGVVTASRKSETDEYQITSYTETKTAIQQYILDRYGGMIRVRKGEGAVHYIDWVQDYGVVNPQPIELGSNVRDQTNAITADGLFTVLRPVGANGLTLPQKTIDVYPSDKVARIGRIVKTEVFQDADTEEKLLAKANSYISRIEKKLDKETRVNLVDFHFLNGSVRKIRLGDMFTNIYGFEDDTLTVYNVDQDILRIENGQYTLKNKKELGTVTDGRVKGGSISKASARGARSGGLALKYYHEAVDEATLEVKKLHIIADDMDMHLQTLDIDVAETADIAARSWTLSTENYESISHVENTIDEWSDDVAQIYGINMRLRTVEGSGVIQNSDHITTVSGKFEIWMDPATQKETVHLVDGAEMAVDGENGTVITVGSLNSRARSAENAIARHQIEIDGVAGVVSEMSGSALWTQKDHIVGVSGEFDVIELPDPENPGHYIKHLKIVSGGGMTVERDNVEYGLYDNGNLTGGLIVQKINSQTSTQIKGDLIKIGELSDKDLDTWAAEAKSGTGVFAKFLTVRTLDVTELEALLANIGQAEIDTLWAEHVGGDQITATGSVHAPNVTVQDGHLYFGVDEEQEFNILDASVSSDGKTLTLYRAHGQNVTFSKATSLSGEWSGTSTFTVTASPQNEKLYRQITHSAPYKDENDRWKVEVYATIPGTGMPPTEEHFGHNINLYNYLQDKTGTNKITANGTYTPTGSAIGFSAVQVDVQTGTTLSGAWSSAHLEVTASPQNEKLHRYIYSGDIEDTSSDGNSWYVPILSKNDPNASSSERTGHRVLVNATGRYNAGWGAARDKVNFPSGSGSASSITVYGPASTVGNTDSRTYSLANNGNNAVKLYTTVGSMDVTVANYTHGKYDAGWGAAEDKVSFPTGSGSSSSITVSGPSSTVGGTASRSYTLANNGNNAVKLYTTVGSMDVTVANYTHGKYDAGWAAAVAQNSIPTSSNTGNSRTFYWPSSTVGSSQNRTYTLANDGDNAVKLYTTVNGSNVTIARIAHNKYSSGYSSGWTTAAGKVVTPTTSNTGSTLTITYPNKTTPDGSNGSIQYSVSVDNSYAYIKAPGGTTVARVSNSGYSAGYNAGYSAAISDVKYVTTDPYNNHIGDWWNFRLYTGKNGTLLKDSFSTDLTSVGMYVPGSSGGGGATLTALTNTGGSEPSTNVYLGDLTSGSSDNWIAIKAGDTVAGKFRLMKASGGDYDTPSLTVDKAPYIETSSSGTSMGPISSSRLTPGNYLKFKIKASANGKNRTVEYSIQIT